MRSRVVVILGIFVLATIAAIDQHNQKRPASTSRIVPQHPPTVKAAEVPSGKMGLLRMPIPGAYVSVLVWFKGGSADHKGVLSLLMNASRLNPGGIGIMGVVGARNPQDERIAKDLGVLRPYDVILVNGQEEFVITSKSGATKRIKLKGKEGTDYSVSELREVLKQVFEKEYPKQKFRLPPL